MMAFQKLHTSFRTKGLHLRNEQLNGASTVSK